VCTELECHKMNNKNNTEKSVYLKIIEFGLRYPKGFNYNQFLSDKSLLLGDWEKKIFSKYLDNAFSNSYGTSISGQSANAETIFFLVKRGDNYLSDNCGYIINLEATFSYIDYQELKFARQNAMEARSLSEKAIKISLAALIVSAFVPILIAGYMTQTVEINDNQFSVIKSISTNTKPK